MQLAALREQLDAVRRNGVLTTAKQEHDGERLADLERHFALLDHKVEELRKGKEEWGRRAWAVVGPVLGALMGVALGYLLKR